MMLITSLLFVLSYQVSSHELLYAEIEYLGGSCYPSDSCKTTRIESEDHLWGNYSCECGEHCIQYGTCCADSPYFGQVLHVPYRGETCKKLTSVSNAVIMVSRCPERWRNGFETLKKCVTPDDDMEDPVSMIPVTSLETSVTYKNFFCAVCNHDYRNVYLWNISLELNKKLTMPGGEEITESYIIENMIYNKEKTAWGLFMDDDFYKLNLRFQVPSSIQRMVKKCYRNMVMQCNLSYANNTVSQYKCWSYYSPIQIKEVVKYNTKYRNIHCAMCNNVNITDDDMDICKLDVPVSKKVKPSFSFALLLDINRSDGELVGLKKLCEDDQTWDPFFKKCRSLVCAIPGYVVKNGRCVPNQE